MNNILLLSEWNIPEGSSVPLLIAELFRSAINFLDFKFCVPPCLFLQSLMGNYEVTVQLDVFKIQRCMSLAI